VTKASASEQEERTRLTCHCLSIPLRREAFKEIIAHLDRLRRKTSAWMGTTYSDPGAFSAAGGKWAPQAVVGCPTITLLIVDFKYSLTIARLLSERSRSSKNTIHHSYAKFGRPRRSLASLTRDAVLVEPALPLILQRSRIVIP